MKLQRKNAIGRQSKQHPYHPQPKSSSVQNAVGSAHQESVSTATNEHARICYQPSQKSLSGRNEPSVGPSTPKSDFGSNGGKKSKARHLKMYNMDDIYQLS